ncbi:dTDP-glucose 4,6-dehydratase [Sphingomonas bacterium]|uniref:dTDP-glucose 4,6-dehydratase n=1 Tax=Sphingomonas bacterium TaxID=1895847 RepID=UPI0015775804|nr:dTDP-glucose 4,6-dehydratase [Sphingomonas bacterium]
MANLLVTGGAGFIGSNYARQRRAERSEDVIVVLDALTYAGNRESLAGVPDIIFVEGDIGDRELVDRLLSDHQLDTIVHFAAESHVDRSISGPEAFVQTNVVGTHVLLQAARAAWLTGAKRPHRFHHVSTDEVYGTLEHDDPAFTEETPYRPNSPYSASKAGSDHLVRAYHHTYGLETTISNCSNNYGPYQFPEKLIPLFTLNALAGRPLPVYGDGMNVRDWLHVEDHCHGISLVVDKGRPGEVYNIGGGQELPNLRVIEEICRGVDAAFAADVSLAGRFPDAAAARGAATRDLISYVTDRPGHDRRYAIDETKIRSELGYAPQRDFSTGFAETLAWFLGNEGWWRPLLDHASISR